MVLGEVLEIRMVPERSWDENSARVPQVIVQPLGSSRWKQHCVRTFHVDTRTGKRIDRDAPSGKHILIPAHYVDAAGDTILEDMDRPSWHARYYDADSFTGANAAYTRGRKPARYVRTVYQPWVEERTEDRPRPVTLMVTENIVKWTGPAPEAEILSG
jgi:hypothetical protein